MPRIGTHRRFTANHTWHVDWAGHRLFVKANPHSGEARAEREGHRHLRGLYPVPELRGTWRLGRWTVQAYDRWPHLGPDSGLLLDEITQADLTQDTGRLDTCLDDVFGHYRRVLSGTIRRVTAGETVGKLYGQRAAAGGRLDQYYQADAPWPLPIGAAAVRPSDFASLRLVVNGKERSLDFAGLVAGLRAHFAAHQPVWAAVTQGDPTDLNIGWTPAGGAVWFDYDTAGLGALAGEFACFLLYQRLHGAWLVPRYHRDAFRDHPRALGPASLAEPTVRARWDGSSLTIDYRHEPSPARRHVMRRYLDDLVYPVADALGIDHVLDWLRPSLAMRLLAVYNLADLEPRDSALCLALLAQTLDRTATLPDILTLAPRRTETSRPWPVPLPS
jgi:hypothetical protein